MEGFFGAIRDSIPDFWGRCVIERNTGHTQLEEFDHLMYGPDFLHANSIIIAAGLRPENSLVSDIESLVPKVYTGGDAKDPRNALDAIKEGFLVGLKI